MHFQLPTLLTLLTLTSLPLTLCTPTGPVGDPSGAKNVGNGKGLQFITGGCLSNADCASTCCAGPNGVCSAVAVANVSGKTGCGFVSTAATGAGGKGGAASVLPPCVAA